MLGNNSLLSSGGTRLPPARGTWTTHMHPPEGETHFFPASCHCRVFPLTQALPRRWLFLHPSPMPIAGVAALFNRAQETAGSHKKCIEDTVKNAAENDGFAREFMSCLNRVLLVFKREPAVERIVAFAAKAIAEVGRQVFPDLPFSVLEYLVDCSYAKDKAVRMRSCQIIGNLLDCLDENVELSETLCQKLEDAMLVRIYDRVSAVRMAAVSAISRLQIPQDTSCPIIEALLELLAFDPAKEVRKFVLTRIAICARTLPEILNRSRDVSEDVRKQAFTVIGQQIQAKHLSHRQRAALVEQGLRDANLSVRKACIEMLHKQWAATFADSFGLLQTLDVVGHVELCDAVVAAEIERNHKAALVDLAALSADKEEEAKEGDHDHQQQQQQQQEALALSPEQALYLKASLKAVASHVSGSLSADDLVPDVMVLCERIEWILATPNLLADPKTSFVCSQLLESLQYVDTTDESIRRKVLAFARRHLTSPQTPLSLLSGLAQAIVLVTPSFGDRLAILSETASEILDACPDLRSRSDSQDDEDDMAGKYIELMQKRKDVELLRRKLSAAEAELVAASRRRGNASAVQSFQERVGSLQQEISETEAAVAVLERQVGPEQTDGTRQSSVGGAATEVANAFWLRCLTVTSCVLENINHNHGSGSCVEGLIAKAVLPAMRSESTAVRCAALKSMSLYCLLNKAAMADNLELYSRIVVGNEETEVQCIAIRSLFDFALLYGHDVDLETDSRTSSALQRMLELLHDVVMNGISSAANDLVFAVVEGLCKLFLYSRKFRLSQAMRDLALLYFVPSCRENHAWKTCLSAFFPAFAFCSAEHQQFVGSVVMPCLELLLQNSSSGESSELSNVNTDDMLVFLLFLCDDRELSTPNRGGSTAMETVVPSVMKLALEMAVGAADVSGDWRSMVRIVSDVKIRDDSTACMAARWKTAAGLRRCVEVDSDKTLAKVLDRYLADLQAAGQKKGLVLELELELEQIRSSLSPSVAEPEKAAGVSEGEGEESEDQIRSSEDAPVVCQEPRASRTRRTRTAAKPRVSLTDDESGKEEDEDDRDDEFRIEGSAVEDGDSAPKGRKRAVRKGDKAVGKKKTASKAAPPAVTNPSRARKETAPVGASAVTGVIEAVARKIDQLLSLNDESEGAASDDEKKQPSKPARMAAVPARGSVSAPRRQAKPVAVADVENAVPGAIRPGKMAAMEAAPSARARLLTQIDELLSP